MIKSISDLEIGQEYTVLFIKDKTFARKAKIHAIINETVDFISDKTEIYISLYQRNKLVSKNLIYVQEIGIGKNAEEAYKNYGKFKYEDNDKFSNCFEKVKN